MNDKVKVAILGSTGFVGIEIIKILLNHSNVEINFLGCAKVAEDKVKLIKDIDKFLNLPKITNNDYFNPLNSDVVFLSLPHGVSNNYAKEYYGKIKIIDLSADFRLDSRSIYEKNYNENHTCLNLLDDFIYGLTEINHSNLKDSSYVSIPGCYPTSVLLPLIPIIQKDLIETNNIIIDSKSGYSGAGKNFDLENIKNSQNYNFYNYSTNEHRHICEIQQELDKHSTKKVNFSFNPHILPIFRGMMSTIYCDLKSNSEIQTITDLLSNFYKDSKFVKIINNNKRADFFSIQNTNFCLIRILKYHPQKIIIISLIDNLLKGAAGQAVQCFNVMHNFDEANSLL